jgi:hypothetical protein
LELFAAVGAVKLPVVVVEWFGLCWATVPVPPVPVPPVPVHVPASVVIDRIVVGVVPIFSVVSFHFFCPFSRYAAFQQAITSQAVKNFRLTAHAEVCIISCYAAFQQVITSQVVKNFREVPRNDCGVFLFPPG